jgi:hypothetical protein
LQAGWGRPGTSKSGAARAVARIYAELGLLSSGHVDEIAAASVVGATPRRPGSWWARRSGAPAGDRDDPRCARLAGQAGSLRDRLRASPPLAARFPAVIDFPGYTARQLAAIFATLVGEAGFTLTPDAAR